MSRTKEYIGFGGLVLGIFYCWILLDSTFQNMNFLTEGAPLYSWYFVARSAFSLGLALVSVIFFNQCRESSVLDLTSDGDAKFRIVAAWIAVLCVLISGFMIMFNPPLFNALSLEDSVFEDITAALLLLSSGYLIALVFISTPKLQRWSVRSVLILSLAFVFFLIGMEEISWMQRIFDVATPSWLQENNYQYELNLHNVATASTENLFYACGFVLLALYPFVSYGSSIWKHFNAAAFLVPSRYIVVLGALTTVFSYEMWNILWIQVAYFLGLAIIFLLGRNALHRGRNADFVLFSVAFITLIVVQFIDLSFGSLMVRRWDDTEFKELIIAFGLAVYAYEIGQKVRALKSAPSVSQASSKIRHSF